MSSALRAPSSPSAPPACTLISVYSTCAACGSGRRRPVPPAGHVGRVVRQPPVEPDGAATTTYMHPGSSLAPPPPPPPAAAATARPPAAAAAAARAAAAAVGGRPPPRRRRRRAELLARAGHDRVAAEPTSARFIRSPTPSASCARCFFAGARTRRARALPGRDHVALREDGLALGELHDSARVRGACRRGNVNSAGSAHSRSR